MVGKTDSQQTRTDRVGVLLLKRAPWRKWPWLRVCLRGDVECNRWGIAVFSFLEPEWVSTPLWAEFLFSNLVTADTVMGMAVSLRRGTHLQWMRLHFLKPTSQTPMSTLCLQDILMTLDLIDSGLAVLRGFQLTMPGNVESQTPHCHRTSQFQCLSLAKNSRK